MNYGVRHSDGQPAVQKAPRGALRLALWLAAAAILAAGALLLGMDLLGPPDPTKLRFREAVWTPDSRYILMVFDRPGDGWILFISAQDPRHKVWHRIHGEVSVASPASFSPDGHQVAFVEQHFAFADPEHERRREVGLRILTVGSESSRWVPLPDDAEWRLTPIWTSDGNQVCLMDGAQARFFDLATGKETRTLGLAAFPPTYTERSPTRPNLMMVLGPEGPGRQAGLFDMADGTWTSLPNTRRLGVSSVAWAADGTHLLGTTAGQNTTQLRKVLSLPLDPAQQARPLYDLGYSLVLRGTILAISPSGLAAAGVEQTADAQAPGLYAASIKDAYLTLLSPERVGYAVGFSPDGKLLAYTVEWKLAVADTQGGGHRLLFKWGPKKMPVYPKLPPVGSPEYEGY